MLANILPVFVPKFQVLSLKCITTDSSTSIREAFYTRGGAVPLPSVHIDTSITSKRRTCSCGTFS